MTPLCFYFVFFLSHYTGILSPTDAILSMRIAVFVIELCLTSEVARVSGFSTL